MTTANATEAIASPRLTITETCRVLRLSRAAIYQRIAQGLLRIQKDGKRSYVTPAEITRYVASCGSDTEHQTLSAA